MIRSLATLWKDTRVSLEQKLDLLGELTIKDSEYFMEKVYPGVQIHFWGTQILELIKMDEYMLEKYCCWKVKI